MQFRSTTDEMLAARFDPEPYRCGGKSGYELRHPSSDITVCPDPIFDPRPEFIPSRDPYPWNGNTAAPESPDDNRFDFEQGLELVENWFALEWDPRPVYARPEPNPILVAWRSRGTDVRLWLRDDAFNGQGYTHSQIEHARKVLTRLANIYKED